MSNYSIIPEETLYNMIYNYGPNLRYSMSRNSFKVYETQRVKLVEIEKMRMESFYTHFSPAVPDKKIIKSLQRYIGNEKALEIESYLGLWSYLLYIKGTNIKPTDHRYNKMTSFIDIEKSSILTAINNNNDRNVLMVVWDKKRKDHDKLYEGIKHFKGDKIILISEKKIASHIIDNITPSFSKILEDLKDKKISYKWISTKEYEIPQWLNLDYKIYLLEKQQL